MAMSPLDAAASLQNKKAKTQSSMQEKFITDLTRLTGSFLDEAGLAEFCKTARFVHVACQDDMAERRKVREELLPHVFNADPAAVQAFFTMPSSDPKMVLTKTSFREGYQSQKHKKFICFRDWKGVSPLQAAALCLDHFLVIKLLAYIVRDNALRKEAIKQLEEVKARIEWVEQKNVEAAAGAAASGVGPCASNHHHPGLDEKVASEEAQITADLAEYAAPLKALDRAYSEFQRQHPLLSSQRKWAELDKLWDVVGDCQKKLPRYVLQEFFKEGRWSDDPDFTHEPPRGPLRYRDGALLGLDGLGGGTFGGLYKGPLGGGEGWCWRAVALGVAQIDSAALSHLCELRLTGLRNIIARL